MFVHRASLWRGQISGEPLQSEANGIELFSEATWACHANLTCWKGLINLGTHLEMVEF